MDIEDGTATPLSPVSVELAFRGHRLVQDKPPASGGSDRGPMASEYLLGALLACQHSTFVKVAAKRRVPATPRSLRGELHFKDGAIARITVHFDLEAPASVTDGDLGTLLRLTDRACTISQALKTPIEAAYSRSTAPAASASSR
ncbi:MAG TPA: OsmC family protein [Candidatus Thermoplasmatota archaeon]|nr:OsmC family protein [Candidatus Thermoplasmatota archaeon]